MIQKEKACKNCGMTFISDKIQKVYCTYVCCLKSQQKRQRDKDILGGRGPLSLRFEVLARSGFSCVYCGRKPPEVVLEVDHQSPVGSERSHKINVLNKDNLVASCRECNRGKGDRLLAIYNENHDK